MDHSKTKLFKIVRSIKETCYNLPDVSNNNQKLEKESIITKTFTDKGHLIEKNEAYFSDNPYDPQSRWTIQKYDLVGNLIEIYSCYKNGTLRRKTIFEYNKSGKPIHANIQEQDGLLWHQNYKYDTHENLIEYKKNISSGLCRTKVSIKYNSQNQKIEETESYNEFITKRTNYLYDEGGKLIKSAKYDSNDRLSVTKTYNNKGEEIMIEEYDIEGIIDRKFIFEYDDFGNLLRREFYNLTKPEENEEIKYTYIYDNLGNWIKKTSLEKNIPLATTEREIDYFSELEISELDFPNLQHKAIEEILNLKANDKREEAHGLSLLWINKSTSYIYIYEDCISLEGLSRIYFFVANDFNSFEKHEEALIFYEKSLKTMEKCCEINSSQTYIHDLAAMHYHYANQLELLNQKAKALLEAQKSLQLLNHLIEQSYLGVQIEDEKNDVEKLIANLKD
ncbi:MAG TPA: hypothetical protein VMV77_20470 [Bacteroidales bacterium]|nr:hypothetical protein [Bacteroidales bacterium]